MHLLGKDSERPDRVCFHGKKKKKKKKEGQGLPQPMEQLGRLARAFFGVGAARKMVSSKENKSRDVMILH